MKKHFKKELVTTKDDNEDFENFTKCWISDNVYVKGHFKVRDHCHIKYRRSVHKVFDIKVKLNHKITIVFHNLKNYNPHLAVEKLGKFDFKINTIPNG